MNRRLAHLLTSLYPRDWKERYGEEFEALLLAGRGGVRPGMRRAANVLGSAFREHIFPTQGSNMTRSVPTFGAIVKQPSAFLPLVMSLTALALVLGHIAIFGAVQEMVGGRPDEGAAAHIWQLLMAGQLPVLAFFAIKWLPRAPKQSLGVLALQTGAVLASMVPIFILKM